MNIKELTRPHMQLFGRHLLNLLRKKGFINRIELDRLIEEEELAVLGHLCNLLGVEDESDIAGTVEWDEYVIAQYLMCKEIYLNYIWEEYSYVNQN